MSKTCLLPSNRVSRGKRAAVDDSINLQIDGDEKREHGPGKKSGPLLSGTAYCISSCSMILLNKVVLSGYNFNAGISLMFYQVCHPFAFQVGWSMPRCLMSPTSNIISTLHAFASQSITEQPICGTYGYFIGWVNPCHLLMAFILPCALYQIHINTMTSFLFPCNFMQNLISSLVVVLLGLCRVVSVEKLNWKLIRVWIPVNVIFIGMLVSGMYRYVMNCNCSVLLLWAIV